jgi:mono/diheme cytochrome c family protein
MNLKSLIALAALCAASARADDAAFSSTAGLANADGQQIYAHICQGCHMPEGQGAVGAGHYPPLASDPRLASWQYLAVTVLNGRNGMPPFGLPQEQTWEIRTAHLSDAQIAEVVNYVRTHFGNTYTDKATAEQVQALPHPNNAANAQATD